MKIGMICAWNTDSGVALHAEPIVKSWIKMGHELTVFSFTKEDFHGEGFTGEDEDYVIRCLGTKKTNFLDPRPILTHDFDIFVVQDLMMLPLQNLSRIFPVIQKKAKTVHIVHENRLPEDPAFYQFGWDGVIYFCRRQNFLNAVYPEARLIHFPCFPARHKDQREARERLDLPLDKKIVYVFCQRGYKPFCRELPEELKGKAVLLVVIPPSYEFLEEDNPPPWMIVRREDTLWHERFDDYLFASDVMILHKFQSRYHAVVSSTTFQALGTDCPMLVPGQSDFFFPFHNEVIRYEDIEGLKEILTDILEDGATYEATRTKARQFVKKNSPEAIAVEHIEFFNHLRRKK